MKIKYIALLMAISVLIVGIYGCNKKDTTTDETSAESIKSEGISDDSFFEWEGNTIIGLTEKGKKQKKLIIPRNCEGIETVFVDSEATSVEFEDDDDIFFGTAFMGMSNLKEITLPKNLTKLDSMSFESCSSLEKIVIPENVELIDVYTFSNCSSLSNVEFAGDRIKEIQESAFSYCKSISSIHIPNNVAIIGENAFLGCSSLTTVYLSDTVTEIRHNAFLNANVKDLYLSGGIETLTIDSIAFGPSASQMTVHVVKGSWCDNNRDVWDIGFSSIIAE